MYSILVRSYFQNSKHLFRLYQAPKPNAYNASEKNLTKTYRHHMHAKYKSCSWLYADMV